MRGYENENKIIITEQGKFKFYKHAIVPYSNILNYDFKNDECSPYLYCKYNGEIGPFKELYFRKIEL